QGLNVLGTLAKPVQPLALRDILGQGQAEALPAGEDGMATAKVAVEDASALEAAITSGELFNLYQPKIDLASGEVVGVEALARWQHRTRGIVMPTEFVPLAERAG